MQESCLDVVRIELESYYIYGQIKKDKFWTSFKLFLYKKKSQPEGQLFLSIFWISLILQGF